MVCFISSSSFVQISSVGISSLNTTERGFILGILPFSLEISGSQSVCAGETDGKEMKGLLRTIRGALLNCTPCIPDLQEILIYPPWGHDALF